MAQTVTQVLTAATDSVTLINAVNGGSYNVTSMTQARINKMDSVMLTILKLF